MRERWSSEPIKLERIIKAIANTNMKSTLKTLNVYGSGMSRISVENFLEKYDMDDVEVVYEENDTSDD